jgi:hypothetical protein
LKPTEYWNSGAMEYRLILFQHSIAPIFHHSNIPPLSFSYLPYTSYFNHVKL